MRSTRGSVAAAALLLVTGSGSFVQTAPAVIAVNTVAPGIAADGLCSLAEAIGNANAAAPVHADCGSGGSPTTIELAAAAIYTIDVALDAADDGAALPAISGAIVIDGRGAIVERGAAAPPFRLVRVAPGASLTLNNLTLRHGLANQDGTGLGGGAILNSGSLTLNSAALADNRSGTHGGALTNSLGQVTIAGGEIRGNVAARAGGGVWNRDGSVALAGVLVTGNQTTGTADDFARGGGVANHALGGDATMTVTGSVFSANISNGIGGGGLDNAAATGRAAAMTISESTIANNTAVGAGHAQGFGGGVQNSFFRPVSVATATLSLDRSIVIGNVALNGGGISSGFDLPGTQVLTLQVTHSEISGNTAAGDGFQVASGGGVYLVNSATTLANTTISGNAATGTGAFSGRGGGIMNAGLGGRTGDLTLLNVTVASNAASNAGGGIANDPFNGFATAALGNTLVAGNSAPVGAGCANVGAGVSASLGHNLEAGNTCQFAQPTDLVNTNPLLGVLLDNGGLTQTQALLPGSPAIDAGDDGICAAPPVAGVDQRGTPRPQRAACDIGAYEVDRTETSLTLDTLFRLSDGSAGAGRFSLLVDGTFVDQIGMSGTWSEPSTGTLRIQYRQGFACDGLWIGVFTAPGAVSGRQFCLDGSGVRGQWRANATEP